MSDLNDRERMQLMRMMLVAAQTMIIVNNVADISVSVPMAINVNSTAQNFEGWGTSLAWFGEYVGGLEGVNAATFCILLFSVTVNTHALVLGHTYHFLQQLLVIPAAKVHVVCRHNA